MHTNNLTGVTEMTADGADITDGAVGRRLTQTSLQFDARWGAPDPQTTGTSYPFSIRVIVQSVVGSLTFSAQSF
jgi:hypothetical protein